jgi:hypothetical protein
MVPAVASLLLCVVGWWLVLFLLVGFGASG